MDFDWDYDPQATALDWAAETHAAMAADAAPDEAVDDELQFMSFMSGNGPQSFEPNNTSATAVKLTKGTYDIAGQGEDWFRLDTGAGAVNLTMTPATGTDVNMILHNANMQVVAANFQPGQEVINWNTGVAGPLFVKLFPTADTTSSYQLVVDHVDPPNQAYEPNNTQATAVAISKGTITVDGTGDDWFKFEAGQGNINLVMTPAAGQDVNMVLYNAAGQAIQANFAAGTETINYDALDEGTYFVKMSPAAGNTSSYALTLDHADKQNNAYEDNNTFAKAKEIQEGTINVEGTGDDWFKFKSNPGPIKLVMTPEAGRDVNMVLYDSKGQSVASSLAAGQESVTYYSNTSDYFYVKMSPAAGNVSTYSLALDLPDNSWAVELPFGPIGNSSISLFDIDDDGKDEIFIGTSKGLDAQYNEVRPAGLIVLEDDGTVKWTKTFAAIDGQDFWTKKTYNTTSVTGPITFSDIDGDDKIDVLVGVGGERGGEHPDSIGQPGDKGGLYALNADGSTKWFHESIDWIGGTKNEGDGQPDGVHGAAQAFDIDRDGKVEVIYNAWDQRTWVLNGADGVVEASYHLLDTSWSNVTIADLNRDNIFEILVNADITTNAFAQTTDGGVFHVFSVVDNPNYDPAKRGQTYVDPATGKTLPVKEGEERKLVQTTSGFDEFYGNQGFNIKGKWEDQPLWSTPVTGDLDGDGELEIAYGTGNYLKNGEGEYIRVWNHDGTEAHKLVTEGRTFATPIIADLDADGDNELVAADLKGNVYAWDHTGAQIFKTATVPFNGGKPGGEGQPIFSSPIAVDLDGDKKLELLFSQGASLVVLDHAGKQLSSNSIGENIFHRFTGSPAAADINGDGRIEIISGGTNEAKDQAVVYRWDNPLQDTAAAQPSVPLEGRYQFHQSLDKIDAFVDRFYKEILGREAEARGNNYWNDSLYNGTRAASDVAKGFIFSQEFANRGVSDADYVEILYRAFFDRPGDTGGASYWLNQLSSGASRAQVLDGFLQSQEFSNLALAYSIKPTK